MQSKLKEIKQKFLLWGIHLYGALCFIVFGFIYWFLLQSSYMMLSNCFIGLLIGLNWMIYLKIKKEGENDLMIATSFLILVYLGGVNFVSHIGVYDSPLMYWGLSIVVTAAFVYQIRGILIWVILSLLFYPLSLFLKRNWLADRVISLNQFQIDTLNAASYLGILIFLGLMFYLLQVELSKTISNLNRSEEKYRGLFNASMDAIIVFDQDTLIIDDANPAFCELYGYTRKEVHGLSVLEITAEPEKTIDVIKENVLKVSNRIHKKKDGTIFPVEISSGFFSDQGKNYCVGTLNDISDRLRIEAEHEKLFQAEREARIEANQANKSKDVFLSTLSHELRTPLTAIQGWAQLLRIGQLDAVKTKHAVEAIEKSALSQGRIINDLLDVSRIIMGKIELEIEEINPKSIVNEAIDSVQITAIEKSISIETLFDPNLDVFYADPVRIKQIIWNLLSNAIKFSHQNGKIKIQVSTYQKNHLRILVSDEGKGIPTELTKEIFDPFKQADSSSIRTHGGLGLGLTIVRTLVELHGGTVSAESAGINQGSTFTVLLPLSKM